MPITRQTSSTNNHPLASPDPVRITKLNRLADNITEPAAHLDAGTFQLLQLICEFDKNEGWDIRG